MSKVAIIGAGFGGLSCARALVNNPVDVLLIDKNNYHLFTPLLYQVASSLLDPSDIAYPVRAVFRRSKNVRFQMALVTEMDLHARLIKTNDGALIPYDYAVLATGRSVTNYFSMQSVSRIAYELKDIPEALELRNHILRCFEAAARETNETLRRRWLTFVLPETEKL